MTAETFCPVCKTRISPYKLKAEIYHCTYKDLIPHEYNDTSYYYINKINLSKDGKITYPTVKVPDFYIPVQDENGNFTDEKNYWRSEEQETIKHDFIRSATIYNTLVSAIKKLDKNIVIEPIPFSVTE